MKDILKMMRFDFISSLNTAAKGANYVILSVIMTVMLIALPLFITPMFALAFVGAAGAFIVPMQSGKKDDLGRLYGTLPVARKNITRARFFYIFLLHFAAGGISALLAYISVLLDLNRFLPQSSEFIQILSSEYNMETFSEYFPALIGFTVFSCVMFAFMEMMGQIFGRENEMKILMIVLGAIVVLVLGGVFILGQLGSPEIKFPEEMPAWASLSITILAVFGICVLFGEITAAKLAGREL